MWLDTSQQRICYRSRAGSCLENYKSLVLQCLVQLTEILSSVWIWTVVCQLVVTGPEDYHASEKIQFIILLMVCWVMLLKGRLDYGCYWLNGTASCLSCLFNRFTIGWDGNCGLEFCCKLPIVCFSWFLESRHCPWSHDVVCRGVFEFFVCLTLSIIHNDDLLSLISNKPNQITTLAYR